MAYQIIALKITAKNLCGKVFGKLTVLKPVKSKGKLHWLCQCSCGITSVVLSGNLTSGNTKSCGCGQKEALAINSTKHGLSTTSEYKSWSDLKCRCNNPKMLQYNDYGGRGIHVCSRWDSFELFFADMGPKPTPKHSIDRIDNDGDYCPENCKWSTPKEQQQNTRQNKILVFKGVSLNVSQWTEKLKVNRGTLFARLASGWSVEKTLSEPIAE